MIVILFIVVSLCFLFWWKQRGFGKSSGGGIPGPDAYPIVGNLLSIPLVGAEALKAQAEMIKQYGRLIRLWMGHLMVVIIVDPSEAEVLLKSQNHITKVEMYDFLHPWLGTGLLTSTGAKWRTRRKAITPAFHFKILDNFIDLFNKNGSILVERIKSKEGEGAFNIHPFISSYALDIICETAMGTELGSQAGNNADYYEALMNMSELLGKRFNTPLLHITPIYYLSGYKSQQDKYIHVLKAHTNKVIQMRKEEIRKAALSRDNSSPDGSPDMKKRMAFLDLLLDMHSKSSETFRTDEDIQEEVDTFMFEGHDTTTSGICFALYQLAANSSCQDELFQELYSKFGALDCNPTMEELNDLKYLDMFIKEVERLFPSVPSIGRKMPESLALPSGYTLPKDSLAVISIYHIHRHEKWFPNPEVFEPKNFLPDAVAARHPFAFIPFSAGPRNCIGQKFAMLELKATLAKLVLNFKLECDPKAEIVVDSNLVLSVKNGPMIKFTKRCQT